VPSSPASCSAIAWAPGYWPGQSGFNDIIAVLYIITILAFVSAIFLIAATMSALIAEQAREIAVLKVLGGRRRQIGGITARTAGLLGLAAAVAGTILGVAVAYLPARYFAERIVDVSLGFGISAPVVVASLVAGPMLAVAASLPALRRALRKPAAEALTGVGTDGGYGSGRLDRAAARSGLLRGSLIPDTMRMGLRDVLRQKRRSIAVIAQVAVAAGLAISFLALGQSITAVIGQTIRKLHVSIDVGQAAGSGQRRTAVRQPGTRHCRRHAGRHRRPASGDKLRAVQRPGLRRVGPRPPSALCLSAERRPLVHRRRRWRHGHPGDDTRPGRRRHLRCPCRAGHHP
jgi:hypothetical protein